MAWPADGTLRVFNGMSAHDGVHPANCDMVPFRLYNRGWHDGDGYPKRAFGYDALATFWHDIHPVLAQSSPSSWGLSDCMLAHSTTRDVAATWLHASALHQIDCICRGRPSYEQAVTPAHVVTWHLSSFSAEFED